jgi:hypothetical protein
MVLTDKPHTAAYLANSRVQEVGQALRARMKAIREEEYADKVKYWLKSRFLALSDADF